MAAHARGRGQGQEKAQQGQRACPRGLLWTAARVAFAVFVSLLGFGLRGIWRLPAAHVREVDAANLALAQEQEAHAGHSCGLIDEPFAAHAPAAVGPGPV